jgi:fumarate reductase subunit C
VAVTHPASELLRRARESERLRRTRETRRTLRAAPARLRPRAGRELLYELISGLSGLALALFMWGHMLLVGSILTGEQGFDWLAQGLEHLYIAQPTVVAISLLFLVHAVVASRKIPAQLRERKRMRALAADLRAAGGSAFPRYAPHLDSLLWIWQVRTGMVLLVLGSFHLVLVGADTLTGLFGERVGIEAATTLARVGGGLWLVYGVLLVCVEFHASVGLYRLAVKWGVGSRLSRRTLWQLERVIFVVFLGLGLLTLAVLAGWLAPPLAWVSA